MTGEHTETANTGSSAPGTRSAGHGAKSTVEEIRARFDNDVERFSNAQSGQSSTMDADLVLRMLTDTVASANSGARTMLDIGCGAGNFTVRVLERIPALSCTLVDLSAPMLDRARVRVTAAGASAAHTIQNDIRAVDLPEQRYDIVVAAAVLHHLRSREQWHQVLSKIYSSQTAGGSFWYFDLVRHEIDAVHAVQWDRYAAYLTRLGGEAYRAKVFDYIDKEDSPESATFILTALLEAGYRSVDIVHKNGPFAAIAAFK